MAEQKKFLDFEGLEHYHGNLKTLLDEKQDALDVDQMEVVNANPFTDPEQAKLDGIEAEAEKNAIATISVNGESIAPDIDRNVDIMLPTPDVFLSTQEEVTGEIGELLENLDFTVLSPITPSVDAAKVGDTVIFFNNLQAIISEIDELEEEFSAVITQVGIERITESEIDEMMGIS